MPGTARQGPLKGIRVVEIAGIGPGPVCGMLLADMGADVLLVERDVQSDTGIARPRRFEVAHRGKSSIALNLKSAEAKALAAALIDVADVVIEGFRPGTMERLGLGPDQCLARNPRLVYGRMTGYGQTGPLAHAAGHDLNYISLTGALHAIGRAGHPPTPPLNLIGDYAGGSMLLALGITSALLERERSGRGQVIDAAMAEGAAILMAPFFGMYAAGLNNKPRGENLLDSGAPFYDVYECADGRYVAFGAIERKFRQVFSERTGFPLKVLLDGDDRSTWPALRQSLSQFFLQKTRAAWCDLLEDQDACVTPVLAPTEVAGHRQNQSRQTFVDSNGMVQPSAAPRFSRTPAGTQEEPPEPGSGGAARALAWGVDRERLLAAGITTD